MSEVTIKLKDYKASGVYFQEEDNSIQVATRNEAIRLAVGFNEKGVFNRPVYMSGPADCDEMLGDIDRKLERKHCYTNRAIRTMVSKAPVYALNLLKVDESDASTNPDVVGYNVVSFDAAKANIGGTTPFKNMFNRSKFWIADPDTMMQAVANAVINDSSTIEDLAHSALFAFGNAGTQDMSLIIRKAENLTGYNVTFLDWYGSEDAIPYAWINPYDYVSDYFIEVIAVKGDFTNYEAFKSDIVWKEYFDASGLKKEKLNKFLRLDAVTVIGSWIGCIIPDFYDNMGKCKSIDYLINKSVNSTGLMFGYNTEALDLLAYNKNYVATDQDPKPQFFIDVDGDGDPGESEAAEFGIDMTGAGITIAANSEEQSNVQFLSYNIKMQPGEGGTICTVPASYKGSDSCEFTINSAVFDSSSNDSFVPAVGDYVRAKNGTMTKIVKKTVKRGENEEILYVYTTLAPVFFSSLNLSTYAVLDDMNIDNDGETNPENLGYQDYMVYGVTDGDSTDEVHEGIVEVHKNFVNLYTNLKFIPLKGLKIGNRHRPGFDTEGKIDEEAGVEKIYSMLKDPAIRKGLLNDEIIDFRYIVDTMGGGLGTECKAKKYLSDLAKSKGHCTALINAPSVSAFAASDAPLFCDDYIPGEEAKPVFNAKYIPEGGNQDHAYATSFEEFTLPTEGNGAKYAAVFTPYLKYRVGVKDVLIPPAADVCNTLMNKFLGGDPYKTNANRNGIIDNPQVTGVEFDWDKEDRAYIEPFGLNAIIMKGSNAMIYGDRTAYQTVNSDYNYLHVRELLNTIEIRCKAVLDDYVYTWNDPVSRSEIYTRVDPILKAMKDSRALAKYELQIDENNNTEEIIDEKFCLLDIGVWVTPNMEKVVARIKVNRGSKA